MQILMNIVVVSPMLAFHKYLPTGNDVPINKHMLKVNSMNTRKRREICSKLTIKRPKRRQLRYSLLLSLNIFLTFF